MPESGKGESKSPIFFRPQQTFVRRGESSAKNAQKPLDKGRKNRNLDLHISCVDPDLDLDLKSIQNLDLSLSQN